MLGVAGACATFTSTDPGAGGGADGGGGDSGDGGAGCQPTGCAGAVPSACTSGCEKFSFNGDPTPQVLGECVNGAVHIKAEGTRDIRATIEVDTPAAAYDTIVISGRLSMPVWGTDDGWAMKIAVDGTIGIRLRAEPRVDGTVAYTFCASDGTTCGDPHKTTIAPPTVLVIRMTKRAIEIEMDCLLTARLPAIPLPTSRGITLELGGSSKDEFEATFSDPTIAFE